MKPRIALVSASVARAMDKDTEPLCAALISAGTHAEIVNWDDAATDWARFELALLCSPWDYTRRLTEFLAWVERVAAVTELVNSAAVARWNCDKHYLQKLADAGLAVVPTTFAEPYMDARAVLEGFLARQACGELVVKPAVGAGSNDAGRYARAETGRILRHMGRLLAAQRSVMLQPYLQRVDSAGETALVFISDRFSHAVRKGPLLPRDAPAIDALLAPDRVAVCAPSQDELSAALRVLAELTFGSLLYARVDLVPDDTGRPCLLELELVEPSLFLSYAPGAVERIVCALLERLSRQAGERGKC